MAGLLRCEESDMKTVIQYLKEYGDYTFEEKPLGEVDSLILSQFSYLKFDGLVPTPNESGRMATMQELADSSGYDRLYADERYREDNTALFLAMYGSKRFGSLKIRNYVNRVETDKETQFSAVTFRLSDGTDYVAFRGTDESIVGWKEDLNLAFSEPVPGQIMSVAYLEQTAESIVGNFYVGGHSKGGNLAVYSSMNCKKEVRDRILKIFDHDGPGFRPEVKAKGAYDEIRDRIHKTVPRSSLVGMLFYFDGDYRVVESKTFGVAQHNPYTWLVKGDEFQLAEQVYAGRRFMDESLNQWILSLGQEEMHTFVDTLYQVMLASGTDNLIDFTANWFKNVQKVRAALKEIDPESAKVIAQIIKAFFEITSKNAKEALRIKSESDREKFEESIAQIEQLFKK